MSAPVDVLAQEIRSIDGSHSMGAGRLAEALMPFIEREFVSRAAVAELIEAARNHLEAYGAGYDASERIGADADLRHALARIGGAA